MRIFRVFGIGGRKIRAMGHSVKGTVTGVQKSYLYVVKKPVRIIPNEKNTLYSHYITFTYIVNGISCRGKLFIPPQYYCPKKGEQIEVFYDPKNPDNYACYAFGPAVTPIGW